MAFLWFKKYILPVKANHVESVEFSTNHRVDQKPPPPESADIKDFGFYLKIIVLIISCFAVYYPILFNDFIYDWDDQWQVMNHYTEGGFNLNNLWAIFTNFFGGQYSPINECMYLFIYSIFGYNPMAFHLASLFLHSGCVCLAYIIIIRIFAQTKHHTTVNASAIAFVTALLFAVHPLNVESVAWVSASKIVVYAFFYLLATYTYLIYLDRKKIAFYFLTIFLFVLSYGGKEQAITFPFWILMLYCLLGHSFKVRKLLLEVAPIFVLSIAFGIATMLSHASNGGGVLTNAETYPLWQRFIFGCYSAIEYVVKFTIPFNLLYIYPFPMVIGEPLPDWMLFYPAIIFIVLVSFWQYVKQSPLSVGLTFFLIHIAFMLHIVPMSRFVIIADRYIYLACIGLAFIFAWYLIVFLTNKTGLLKKVVIGCFFCVAFSLIVYSNVRCRDWKDTNSIKKEMRELLKKRNNFVPPPETIKLMKGKNNNDHSTYEKETSDKMLEVQNYNDDTKKNIMHICSIFFTFFSYNFLTNNLN